MKRVINNKMIMFLIILLFFKPICIQYYSALGFLEKIFVYGKIFAAGLIIFDSFIYDFSKIKINKYLIFVFMFEFCIFLITIFKNQAIFRSFIDFVSIFVLCLAIIKFMKNDKNNTINIIKNVLLFLTFFQLLTEIIWPSGMPADLYFRNSGNPLFFATLDNGTARLTCLLVALIYLNIECNPKHKMIGYFEIVLCLITAIFSGSTTTIICTFALAFFIVFAKKKFMKIFDKWLLWLVFYCILSYFIIFNNAFLSDLFFKLTGKIGFTGRTLLWEKSLIMIKNSILFGYGRSLSGYIEVWGSDFSSHNMILEIALQGGLVCVLLWFCSIIYSLINVKYIKNYKIRRILILTTFVLLISLLMEANVHSEHLFLILTLTNCISNEKLI